MLKTPPKLKTPSSPAAIFALKKTHVQNEYHHRHRNDHNCLYRHLLEIPQAIMKQIQSLAMPSILTIGGAAALIYVISKFSTSSDESDESAIFGMLIIVAGMVCVSGIVAFDAQWNNEQGIEI